MSKKAMTIEDLAVLVKRGFDHTASKEELNDFKREVRKEFGGIKSEIKELREHILHLAADISRLKEDMNRDDPFVEDLLHRMREVEKRVGITR